MRRIDRTLTPPGSGLPVWGIPRHGGVFASWPCAWGYGRAGAISAYSFAPGAVCEYALFPLKAREGLRHRFLPLQPPADNIVCRGLDPAAPGKAFI